MYIPPVYVLQKWNVCSSQCNDILFRGPTSLFVWKHECCIGNRVVLCHCQTNLGVLLVNPLIKWQHLHMYVTLWCNAEVYTALVKMAVCVSLPWLISLNHNARLTFFRLTLKQLYFISVYCIYSWKCSLSMLVLTAQECVAMVFSQDLRIIDYVIPLCHKYILW